MSLLLPYHHKFQHCNTKTRNRSCDKLGTRLLQSRIRDRYKLLRNQNRFFGLNSGAFCCFSAMDVRESSDSSWTSAAIEQDSLSSSRAFWVSRELISWNVEIKNGSCWLYGSHTASISVTNDGIEGYDVKVELEELSSRLPEDVIEKFPHIQYFKPFRVPPSLNVEGLLKSQLVIAVLNPSGHCTTITGLQLPGVIDQLFSYNGPLGAVFLPDAVSLYLWAPTAQNVCALIYEDPKSGSPVEVVHLKESNGVWSAKGPSTWEGLYYVYEVTVYHPTTLRIEKCIANDPYARGLSAEANRTLFVNVDSESLKPDAWNSLADEKPSLDSFSDISIYELHVRDFSANDSSVPSELRGAYLAFTIPNSDGMVHLSNLSDAGITHVHLLPTFQFGGVHDDKTKWKTVDLQVLESLPPDCDEQQAHITAIQNEDGYNWGYNPVLWGVPKGSYATDPNGCCRVIEFRKMVQALNRVGLRVVLDVVYNHLYASGPYAESSVLDKIVPGYYLRRNLDGLVEHSTCINNTASEHYMVERMIIDDLLHWVVNYKVDGFRFDLMGHIMKRTMVKAKSALHALSSQSNGVDGSNIYIYGEGWDFGEVAKSARGVNASQFNLCGTGIGSFNDRIRDAMLGGSPFGHPLQQGFVTGLSMEPNGHDHGGESNMQHMLAIFKDHIQIGMAANLKNFVLTNKDGQEVQGREILTHDGVSVAYASCPVETINYVSAHDNETLFDIVNLKTPVNLSVDDRCRMNHLATSIILLSQGIPFFHAGDEILRSKSLDRDSYNSGDWFNRLDFSYNGNNWGVGLPPKEKNERSWPLIKTRLSDPSYKPDRSHIIAALENFCSLLSIRYSSPLFRLKTASEIQERVKFHNAGPSWVPGVIVMSIEDGHEGVTGLTQLDPTYSYVVVVINASPNEIALTIPELRGKCIQLHPLQMNSRDHIVKRSTYEASSGSLNVPSRTTSVFVENRR